MGFACCVLACFTGGLSCIGKGVGGCKDGHNGHALCSLLGAWFHAPAVDIACLCLIAPFHSES